MTQVLLPEQLLTPDQWQTWQLYSGPVGRMLELGCKRHGAGSFKDCFTAIGFDHVSIDLNGQYGSLPRDLTQKNALSDLGLFDVCTNFGTSEHVADQRALWRNVHASLREAGWIVSVTPAPGNWLSHGRYYPSEQWWLEFAIRNHYELVSVSTIEAPAHRATVGAVLHRKSLRMPPDELMFFNEGGTKVGKYG